MKTKNFKALTSQSLLATATHPSPTKKTSPGGFPVLTHQEDLLPGLRHHPLGCCSAHPTSFSGLSPTACPSGISNRPGGLRSDSQCISTADCLRGLHAPLFRARLSHLDGSFFFFSFHLCSSRPIEHKHFPFFKHFKHCLMLKLKFLKGILNISLF